ncbi:EpsG family protein [Photobacterium sanguinicancri]|uniref:EpsG family protein n=1 Tax=Photobacterium sanguinicancri TaxID=875932 RepID=UPI002480E7C3|nr:EpsG family protein [Photobacterium sanguinicancri]
MFEFLCLLLSPLVFSRLYILSGLHLSKDFRLFSFLLATSLIVTISFLLPQRDLHIVSSGIGTDILHYMDAFEQLIYLNSFNYSAIMDIAAKNTGSWEPFFWILANGLAVIFDSGDSIWSGMIFISLFVFLIGAWKQSPEFALVTLCAYMSTITFYAFSISALRQFLALSFFFLALSFYKNDKVFYISLLLAILSHGTMLIISPLIILAKYASLHTKLTNRRVIIIAFVFSLSLLTFIKIALPFLLSFVSSIDTGIIGKVKALTNGENTNNSISSFVQLFIEGLIFSFYIFHFRRFIPRFLVLSFIFVFSVSIILVLGTNFGDRVYRVIYIIYMVAISCHFSNIKSVIGRYILSFSCVSISFIWFLYLYYERYGVFYFDSMLSDYLLYYGILFDFGG